MHSLASKALFDEQTRALEGDILEVRKWRVICREFPNLDVAFEGIGRQAMCVRMECTDWDELPPSVSLLTVDGQPLAQVPTGPPCIFNPSPHPATGRVFVCMAGTREYHTHPSHVSDRWENYKQRADFDLAGILTKIWDGWLKSRP